jgi:hypothetical protein
LQQDVDLDDEHMNDKYQASCASTNRFAINVIFIGRFAELTKQQWVLAHTLNWLDQIVGQFEPILCKTTRLTFLKIVQMMVMVMVRNNHEAKQYNTLLHTSRNEETNGFFEACVSTDTACGWLLQY